MLNKNELSNLNENEQLCQIDIRESTKIKPCPLLNIQFQFEMRHLCNKVGSNFRFCSKYVSSKFWLVLHRLIFVKSNLVA